MNKNIIIAILVVIIIAVVAAFMFTQPQATTQDGKLNTQINFLSEANLKNGDIVQFELKDAKGNAIANQTVNITFVDNGQKQNFSVITDNSGKAGLSLNNENKGNHEVSVTYGGNNKYNGCNAKTTINIQDGNTTTTQKVTANSTASTAKYNTPSQSASTTSSSSSSSSTGSKSLSEGSGPNLYYDEELNVWYDDNGIVRGGQADGQRMIDLINNQPYTENGGME